MDGRGGSYSRSSFLGPRGKQKTVDEALAGSNPHYREGREWQQNCQRCIYAYEMQRRGIVAVSTKTGRGDDTARYAGVYTFTKGTHFNASGFVKAVNSAQLSGKDYNDAVSKWLKANQQKFGYKYSYQKAK
jgi:hypothetical protein